jgi:hypothetical protein
MMEAMDGDENDYADRREQESVPLMPHEPFLLVVDH